MRCTRTKVKKYILHISYDKETLKVLKIECENGGMLEAVESLPENIINLKGEQSISKCGNSQQIAR